MTSTEAYAHARVRDYERALKRRWLFGQTCEQCVEYHNRIYSLLNRIDALASLNKALFDRILERGLLTQFMGDNYFDRCKWERAMTAWCGEGTHGGLTDISDALDRLYGAYKSEATGGSGKEVR